MSPIVGNASDTYCKEPKCTILLKNSKKQYNTLDVLLVLQMSTASQEDVFFVVLKSTGSILVRDLLYLKSICSIRG